MFRATLLCNDIGEVTLPFSQGTDDYSLLYMDIFHLLMCIKTLVSEAVSASVSGENLSVGLLRYSDCESLGPIIF